ncbi:TetR/AcrR family transcriptional regulator [Deinococcus yunweiensis]|uniref:TetR/AcrR family transcriptional regulator n=1 Tax=Deinococcus yunweiensis TaxID=367282 RepID=UPI00398F3E65
MPHHTDPPPPGRRERHRQDRLDRIQAAALTLFTEQGYDATTVRQIAAAADVATGTVFRYAADKADLLLMVVHGAILQTTEEALRPLRSGNPLVHALPQLFDPFLAFYEPRRELARAFIQHALFHHSPWRTREVEQGHAFVGHLAGVLRDRQQTGEVAADIEPFTAALAIFSLYQVSVVRWLVDDIPLTDLRGQLAALLDLQVRALGTGQQHDPAPR